MQFNSGNYIKNIDAFLEAKEVDASMIQEDLGIANKGTNTKGIEKALANLDAFAASVGTGPVDLKDKVIKARKKLEDLAPKKVDSIESTAKKSVADDTLSPSKDNFRSVLKKHPAYSEGPVTIRKGTLAIVPGDKEKPDEYLIRYWNDNEPDSKMVKLTVTAEGIKTPYSEKCFKTVEEVFEFLKTKDIDVNPKQKITAKTAAKLVAVREAIKERNRVVLPSQIFPFLKAQYSHKYTDEEIQNIAFIICREIEKMTANESQYKGKSLRFMPLVSTLAEDICNKEGVVIAKKGTKITGEVFAELAKKGADIKALHAEIVKQNFSKISKQKVFTGKVLIDDIRNKVGMVIAQKSTMITSKLLEKLEKEGIDTKALRAEMTNEINSSFNLQMDTEGKNIKLSITQSSSPIGKGSYKIVFKQHSFVIPLETQKTAPLTKHRVRTVSHAAETVQNIMKGLDTVIKGLEKSDTIVKKVKTMAVDFSKFKVSKLAVPISPPVNTTNEYQLEQQWYNSDFRAIINTSTINDFNGKPVRQMALKDKLAILVDAAESLAILHESGYVHRDFKPDNLLVGLNGKKIEGYLHDFDYSSKVEKLAAGAGSPRYMDMCAMAGIVVPFSDTYALLVSLGETLLPNFVDIRPRLADKETVYGAIAEILEAFIRPKIAAGDPDVIIALRSLDVLQILDFDITKVEASLGEKIDKLKKNIHVIYSLILRVSEALQREKEIYDYVVSDQEFMKALSSKDEKGIEEGLKRLDKKLGNLSDAAVLDNLKQRQEQLPNE